MIREQTLEKMNAMRLVAMAKEFDRQHGRPEFAELTWEERVGMLVDAEWTWRAQRQVERRMKQAKLRYAATLEEVDYRARRGLDRSVFLALGTGKWLEERRNVFLIGPTGVGKSFLACALADQACRTGFTAHYVRGPRLLHDVATSRGDGTYSRLLARLAKFDLLVIDDWLINPLKEAERRDLLEVIEDRFQRSSTLLASQLPVSAWHDAIGDAGLADAICDRLVHNAHRIELKGASMRDPKSAASKPAA